MDENVSDNSEMDALTGEEGTEEEDEDEEEEEAEEEEEEEEVLHPVRRESIVRQGVVANTGSEDAGDEVDEVYRKICQNLRHNLENIKAYKKATMLPERKAIYLSIVDAAVQGPNALEASEAVAVLGVSESTVGKVRKLAEDVEALRAEEAEEKKEREKRKARSSRKVENKKETSTSSLPLSAHERSHQRSRSAQPLHRHRGEKAAGKDGIARHLLDQFQEYSKLGDRRSDGSHITLSQSDKWLKQARVVDGRTLTSVDTAITWSRMAKNHVWMNFSEWLNYVEEISQDKQLDIHDVREALVLCGKPARPVQDFDTSSIMARLTDVSLYGGTHRRRFDAKGKGLGMSGRRDVRDLPTLWPSPSASGFMATVPSSVPTPGREGATSPFAPRSRSRQRRYSNAEVSSI